VSNPPYELRPIGRVESSIVELADAPCQGDEGAPDAWIADSSAHVTNGELPSPFSVIRAGMAYVIARRPYCFSSGAATSATLFQASSKHRPTERVGSSRSPRAYAAISSEITER